MQRIAIDERRARLVRRHRLSPAERADGVGEAVRSVVVLHSSDPATVFKAVLRQKDPAHSAFAEQALEAIPPLNDRAFLDCHEPPISTALKKPLSTRSLQ